MREPGVNPYGLTYLLKLKVVIVDIWRSSTTSKVITLVLTGWLLIFPFITIFEKELRNEIFLLLKKKIYIIVCRKSYWLTIQKKN